MKYLKSFNESNNTNEYYKQIYQDVPVINISDKVVNFLSNRLRGGTTYIGKTRCGYIKCYRFLHKHKLLMEIFESPDEWFIVEGVDSGDSYLCDQLEGLDKFLSHLGY